MFFCKFFTIFRYTYLYAIKKRGIEMALFDTTAFRVLEQGMTLLWQKQQVIAQNISNADTPEYNCKYIEFGGILREKLRANGSIKNELDLTYQIVTDYATRDQADGNNVDNDTGNKQRYTDDTVSKLIKRMKSTVSRRLGIEGCEYQKQNYTAHKE
jgi:flagellar basal-body rod protein FlgB